MSESQTPRVDAAEFAYCDDLTDLVVDACENEGSYNPPEWAGEFYDMSERALRVVRGGVPETNFGNISTIRGEEE